jgi:hypothetical protein
MPNNKFSKTTISKFTGLFQENAVMPLHYCLITDWAVSNTKQ